MWILCGCGAKLLNAKFWGINKDGILFEKGPMLL